jgi:hypothetical protein
MTLFDPTLSQRTRKEGAPKDPERIPLRFFSFLQFAH